MTQQTDAPVMTLALTDEQRDALVAYVEEHGRARDRAQSDFNEVDYLCGAMAMFFALDLAGRIPPMWIFGPMSGRPVLRDEPQADDDDDEVQS